MKGKFIVIDGTDGSGKATQTKLLVERLKKQGYEVEVGDFPQYGERSAVLVEDYLNGKFGTAKEVGPYRGSIFYAVDRYAASFKIRKWLEQGKIVVSNRYVSANMGHQTGKIKSKEERDKFLAWLEDLEFNIFAIPRPDLNILLYIPPKVGQKLVSKKLQTTIALFKGDDYKEKVSKQRESRSYIVGRSHDIHEADLEHLKEAAEAYKYVAEKYDWAIINCAPEKKLQTIEEIHEKVWKTVQPYLKNDIQSNPV